MNTLQMLGNELEEEYLIKHQANREYLQHLANTFIQTEQQQEEGQRTTDGASGSMACSSSSGSGSRSLAEPGSTAEGQAAAGASHLQLRKMLKLVEQQHVVLEYCESCERTARKAWKFVAAYTGGGK